MKKICTVSGKEFEITDDDLKFYEKMGVPAPTLCPEERHRRRLTWRNERNLYLRKCDDSDKIILSQYSGDKDFVVYERNYWMSDKWNPHDFSADFDFSRPFFEQFSDLMKRVPQASLATGTMDENCSYCNYGMRNKNGYLSYTCGYCEDFYYCHTCAVLKDSADCLRTDYSELCYECIDCQHCFNLCYGQNCSQCRDSFFLKNCRSCTNCFGCNNLSHKEYYIYNKPYSKEAYEDFIKKYIAKNSIKNIEKFWEEYKKKSQSHAVKFHQNLKCENVLGDFLQESKGLINCFDVLKSEDSQYVIGALSVKDLMDVDFANDAELCYESIGLSGYNVIGGVVLGANSLKDIYYSIGIQAGHDLFGCISLKNAQYCILNKQYSKEDYLILRDKIIEHMKESGEWGEFFPIGISPFAYNETVAQEYFPMTKEEVAAKGWKWRDEKELISKGACSLVDIPNNITDVPDSICNEILSCEYCSKNYKIQKAELKFYRKMNLPIPLKCPDCRHAERMKLRNPRKLWKRNCDKCGMDIQTTFAPERPAKVYCEKCYLETID